MQIKEGWGWVKWDVESWAETIMSDTKGEILQDRFVRLTISLGRSCSPTTVEFIAACIAA